MNPSSPKVVLAEGPVSQTDRLVIELVAPEGHARMIMIRWPVHPTGVAPRRYAEAASAAMRLLARANIELAGIRASEL